MRATRLAAVVATNFAVLAIAGVTIAPDAGAVHNVHRPQQQHSAHPLFAAEVGRVDPRAGQPTPLVAGYYSTPVAGVASVGTTFRIPTVTCAKTDTMELRLGVFGVPNGAGDLSQSSQADAQADCSSGTPSYYLSASTVGGGNSFVQVEAGDLVVASLYENGTTTTATARDLSAAMTESSTGASAFDLQQITGAYNYFFPGPIPKFTSITFSKCQVNGDRLGDAAGVDAVKMQPKVKVQISPTALNAAGDRFSVTFKHASS